MQKLKSIKNGNGSNWKGELRPKELVLRYQEEFIDILSKLDLMQNELLRRISLARHRVDLELTGATPYGNAQKNLRPMDTEKRVDMNGIEAVHTK